ncbi:MAG: GldG family protein [Methylococcales bacterium]
MKASLRLHQSRRLKNSLITLFLLCSFVGLANLSSRYSLQTDISNNASNTLSSATLDLLSSLPDPITITAYIKQGLPIRAQIGQLVDRYKRSKANIALVFIDPDLEPEKTREFNIGPEGIILVEYQEHLEKLNYIDESSLTNALLQLASTQQHWLSFLSGHGERSPTGTANSDLGLFAKTLTRRNMRAQTLNLAVMPAIPDNSALLVISAPSSPLLADEWAIIKRYLDEGGNLLVLTEPNNLFLASLHDYLGIQALPGVIVDSDAKLKGIDDPRFVVVSHYPTHAISLSFQATSVFPITAALAINPNSPFKAEPILQSSLNSWTETGVVSGKIRFDANSQEHQGPLTFAYALTRISAKNTEQRIIVVGDSDFVSNADLGHVGNNELGLRMASWLSHDQHFLTIPAKTAVDKSLTLSQTTVNFMGFGFLIVIPLLLISCGFFIWRTRKNH